MATESIGRGTKRSGGERLIGYLELRSFTKTWSGLGLGDVELAQLQELISAAPDGAPVVKQTGGLRKFRYAPSGSGQGKSGALRICYVFFDRPGLVVLPGVYGKNRQEDISASERQRFASAIERIRDQCT